jgi:DNA cross-link repair 1A protein
VPSFIPAFKRLQLGSMQRPILVDAFQYSNDGCDCYFLSHFHADHYMGLDCHWTHGTIYCTATTAGLVRQRLRPKCNIVTMDLDVEYPLIVGGQTVKVTMFDANHCPGSCCMLFSFPEVGRRVLHTGDFRFDAAELMRRSPTWRALIAGGAAAIAAGRHTQTNLCVYLDTTYCEPSHRFPSQRDAVEAVCRHVSACPGVHLEAGLAQQQTLLVFGAYQIGKERVYMSVADLFSPPAKVHVDKHRRKGMLNYHEWPVSTLARLTTEAKEAFIHVVPMNHISFPKLQDRLASFKGRFQRVLAVQPTGWVFKDKGKDGEAGEEVKLQVRSRGDVTIISTPYSEHSSFPELVAFMVQVRPSSVVPTVNTKKDQVQAQLKVLNDAAAPPHLRRS